MGERSKVDVRGFESPKLTKQAKYIYGFVTKNHGLYNKKSPIKSDFLRLHLFCTTIMVGEGGFEPPKA